MTKGLTGENVHELWLSERRTIKLWYIPNASCPGGTTGVAELSGFQTELEFVLLFDAIFPEFPLPHHNLLGSSRYALLGLALHAVDLCGELNGWRASRVQRQTLGVRHSGAPMSVERSPLMGIPDTIGLRQ